MRFLILATTLFFSSFSAAQVSTSPTEKIDLPRSVAVEPKARDAAIEKRIARILSATGKFQHPVVKVDEGIVFLSGTVKDEASSAWAAKLAQNTEDVVAVVNNFELANPDLWDLSPLKNELKNLSDLIVRKIPLFLIAALLISLTWIAAIGTKKLSSSILRARISSPLLRDVLVKITVIPVLILGLFLFLRVSGLTSLAFTLLGGTGLFGLMLGFAFKDIAENFLASILISAQNPFAKDDLIRIGGYEGYVQSVNMRATLLMTLEGNHVQIPNATVYKEIIVNQTANPNMRLSFTVGIGFSDSITKAQSIALSVIENHEAPLKKPEPLVLVDALGAATVNLQVHFWIDITKYSQFKVRSALIRLTKVAFEQNGISMPDEAREIIFPNGVPVRMVQPERSELEAKSITAAAKPKIQFDQERQENEAEGGLEAEAETVKNQAKNSRPLEPGTNLLVDQQL